MSYIHYCMTPVAFGQTWGRVVSRTYIKPEKNLGTID